MHILEKVEIIISNYWLNKNCSVDASEGSGSKKEELERKPPPFQGRPKQPLAEADRVWTQKATSEDYTRKEEPDIGSLRRVVLDLRR